MICTIVILSWSNAEAKNPYDEANKGILPGILRRFAPQNDDFYGEFRILIHRTRAKQLYVRIYVRSEYGVLDKAIFPLSRNFETLQLI